MKRIALLLAVAAMAPASLGAVTPTAHAQTTGPDAIDPIYALTLTEAINKHDPDAVREHFVAGGTVIFDNSVFGIPGKTMTAAEYADRQRPNQPDVPTDIRLEIVDQSLQISATSATWTWRETAGFLKDLKVDYIDFSVTATTADHRFKSISIAPTVESLARLISHDPTNESLVRLPYSPALPTLPFSRDGTIGPAPVVVRVGGDQARGAAILLGKAPQGSANVTLHVMGLAPGTPASASLHAGTCTVPGASAAALPELTVDASGTATASGPVLFRGTESVELSTVADGDHIISISQSGHVVACGRIPAMEGVPDLAPGMPRAGGSGAEMVLLFLAVMSLGLALAGLLMRRASRLS